VRRRPAALLGALLGLAVFAVSAGVVTAADSSTTAWAAEAGAECSPVDYASAIEPSVHYGVADAVLNQSIHVTGTGWKKDAGAGSIIAFKLDDGAVTRDFDLTWPTTSTASDAFRANTTIWGVVAADATGSWSTDLPFPTTANSNSAWAVGQSHKITMLSGSTLTGDVVRTLSATFTVVADASDCPEVEPTAPPSGSSTSTGEHCSPSTPAARATAATAVVQRGAAIRLTGTGWCNAISGGSRIAVKIDTGGVYNRVDDSVHSNRSIWALIDADPRTGDFAVDVRIPDGTSSGADGSKPAFPNGAHAFFLLTGSLKDGDPARSVQVGFVAGEYKPTAIPAPLEFHEDLTKAKRGHVAVTIKGEKLTVKGLPAKTWAYLSAYGVDGSPRTPWGETWFRTDAEGRIVTSLRQVTMPTGRAKFVVQSGEQGEVGALLGWTWVTIKPARPATSAPAPARTPAPVLVAPPPVTTTPVPRASTASVPQAPIRRPAPPAADESGLTQGEVGTVLGAQSGDVVTLTVGGGTAGHWVYLYAYSTPTPLGWAQLDDAAQVRVDVSRLAFGNHKLAVLSADGALLGWAPVTGTSPAMVAATVSPAAAASSSSAAPVAAAAGTDAAGVGAGWWTLGAVLAVVVGGGAGAGLSRRTRQPDAAAGAIR
jgi:hypothetical protein